MSPHELQTTRRKAQYVKLFALIAIGLLLVSAIHLWSILTNKATTADVVELIYHLVGATTFFIASKLVKNDKRAVIFLLGAIGIGAVVYSIVMGRGFNPMVFIIQAFFIWQLLGLWKNDDVK